MNNFKFHYLSRGQLVSLNLDNILLPLLKILPCYEIARLLCGNHLKIKKIQLFFEIEVNILPLFTEIEKNNCFSKYTVIDLNNIFRKKPLISLSIHEFIPAILFLFGLRIIHSVVGE